ncbi:MAG: hypothetical protein AAF430_04110 [Myxococcota bacterium]
MSGIVRRLTLGFSIAALLFASRAGAVPDSQPPLPTPAPQEQGLDLWPLVVATEDEKSLLYPLFVHEDDFTLVFPVYARTRDGRDHHVLWPLVKWSDDGLERAAPFWFRSPQGEFLFFPFFYQSDRYTVWLLPPTWVAKDRPFSAMFPLYVRADDTLYTLPNLRIVDGPGEDLRVTSFGLFDWKRDGDARSVEVALLAGAEWGGERRSARFLPLFQIEESADASRGHAGLVYWSRSAAHSARGVAPLFMHRRTTRPDGASDDALRILWPAYTRTKAVDAEGGLISRNRRFLLFGDERAADGTRTLRFLGLPIWERT